MARGIQFGVDRVAIVCGGRRYRDWERVCAVLDRAVERLKMEAIVQGGAEGADYLAWEWADYRDFPCGSFPADWHPNGTLGGLDRGAGPKRNQRMLDESKPFCVIAFPGKRGTADMISKAEKAGVTVYRIP